MLPKRNELKKNVYYGLVFFCIALFAAPAYSIDLANLSAQDMIINISKQIPNLMRLITALAYVMGMYFMIMGIVKLKHYGEARTQMSTEHSLKGPIVFLIIGALLLYLPTTVSVSLSTFWTDPNPYAYVDEKGAFSDFWNVCFLIIQFLGTLAFIRGLIILSQLSGHAQPGQFGKGVTHIIGGIFCINIYQFIQLIFVTLGIQ